MGEGDEKSAVRAVCTQTQSETNGAATPNGRQPVVPESQRRDRDHASVEQERQAVVRTRCRSSFTRSGCILWTYERDVLATTWRPECCSARARIRHMTYTSSSSSSSERLPRECATKREHRLLFFPNAPVHRQQGCDANRDGG